MWIDIHMIARIYQSHEVVKSNNDFTGYQDCEADMSESVKL